MGEELNRSLRMLAERGEERGAQAVLEDARAEAASTEVVGRPSWRRGFAVALGTALGMLVLVATTSLLLRPFGSDEVGPVTEAPLVPTTVLVTPVAGIDSAGSLNDINDLAVAPDGHLWAATAGGVVRWDMETRDFVSFTEGDGLPGRAIDTLELAPDGTVWVTSRLGIGRYDGSWQVYSGESTPVLDGQFGGLVVDHDGVVWVNVAGEGIAKFDGSWAAVDPAPEGGWPAILTLAVGGDGALWVGTHFEGVFAFDGSTWRYFNESDGAPSRADRVVVATDGVVWASAYGYYTDADLSEYVPSTGVARYNGAVWTTYTIDDGLLANEGSVVVGGDGTVSVVHDELGPDHEPVPIGLSVFNGATWTTFSDVGEGPGVPSKGAVVGPDGIVWTPTASGIVGFDGTDTIELVVPEEMATPPIQSFTLTPDPESTPIQVSTVLGDFEFTTLRTPGHDVFDTETTPFGWMALGGDVVWRSNDGLAWDAALAGAEDLWMMADGSDLIAYGWGIARYSWDGAGWSEVAVTELPGRIQGLAFGSSGAVALVDNTVYYSTDGIAFATAEAGPDPVPSAGRPAGCESGWPEISVAGPGGGPILVTESGYVLLAPASEKWDGPGWCEPLLWVSPDGSNWELVTPRSPFGESTVVDVATFAGRFVAMGDREVWVSDDGIEWQRVEVPQLAWARGIAGGDLGWVLLGGGPSGDGRDMPVDVWFSVDGLNWDGPHAGPEGLGWAFFHIEPTVGTDAILSVNATHDGFVIGRLED